MTTAAIYADTLHEAKCRGRHCYRPIVWAQLVKTGRQMCFDARPEPLEVQPPLMPGQREVWIVDLAGNHWQSCPDAPTFKRGAR